MPVVGTMMMHYISVQPTQELSPDISRRFFSMTRVADSCYRSRMLYLLMIVVLILRPVFLVTLPLVSFVEPP